MKQVEDEKQKAGAALKAAVARRQAAGGEAADASGWSPLRDALLLELRSQGVSWRGVAIPATDGRKHSARACQKRHALLTSVDGRPVARLAKVVEAAEDRDGLDWLARKGRLTPARKAAGLHYRDALRDAGGAMIKSSLDIREGGASSTGEARLAEVTEAKRELFVLRWVVLGGQGDLLTVMDGVCGVGHTLRQLAEGSTPDQVKDRAKVLEAVLMVGLDLVAAHLAARNGCAEAA